MSSDRDGEEQQRHAYEQLVPYADLIAGGAARHAQVSFVPATWREWLKGTDVGPSLERLLASGGVAEGRIGRSDLVELAHVADDPESRLLLLLGTLIWGRGKSNGRMKPHIIRAVTDARRDDVLSNTQRHSRHGDLVAAYRSWNLPGLRAPFFTKWLWASTLTEDPWNQALILDGRVWSSLGSLDWSSVVAAGGDRRRAVRYRAYVHSARRWAEGLSSPDVPVLPADVEWALFHANGDLRTLAATDRTST